MFKKIVAQLAGIRNELTVLCKGVGLLVDAAEKGSEGSTDTERVSALEGAIEALRGEMAANTIYADSKLAAARAAEDRERHQAKRAEKYAELVAESEGGEDEDSFEALGRAYQGFLPTGDDAGSEGLPPVSNGVADRRQGLAMARAAKRGVT